MKHNEKKLLIDNLIKDFSFYLSTFVPNKVSQELATETRSVFLYYLKNKVEEVFLFIKKDQNQWQGTFRICPAYYMNDEKLESMEKYLVKNVQVLSIKDFYLNNVHKYGI